MEVSCFTSLHVILKCRHLCTLLGIIFFSSLGQKFITQLSKLVVLELLMPEEELTFYFWTSLRNGTTEYF